MIQTDDVMSLVEKYVENVLAFSAEAFKEAYQQSMKATHTPERELTIRAHDTIKNLETKGHKIDLIVVSIGQMIILYGDDKYVVIK